MEKYQSKDLFHFAEKLMVRTGLEKEKAQIVADILVEGDLLGHDTHGLALLPAYLSELEKGSMANSGEPEVLHAFPAAALWDGQRLPGPYLVEKAMQAAMEMAQTYGSGSISIRRSHHIACLAAYLKKITDRGFMVQLFSSDPSVASVAPFGGSEAIFTPNPIAVGIPTSGDPILIDISASITTNGAVNRAAKANQQMPFPCLLDAAGRPSQDPKVVTEGGGTIQPVGGQEVGHKGFGLALMIEALTGGLAAFGRADEPEGWGATVFVQVFQPEAFGGIAGFNKQMDWLYKACVSSKPGAGFEEVRMPGQRGLALRKKQLAEGVVLHPSIMPGLKTWADKLEVGLPSAMGL